MSPQQTTPERLAALLPLPHPRSLAYAQLCGRSCLWCGLTLPGAAAIDLGERRMKDGTAWYPRTCRNCVGRRVEESLMAHKALCEQCVDDQAVGSDTVCDTGRALRRLVLEHGQ
ncbi:hypothetical protein [Streptomyces acidicola]|uniref:hypothetical protein n=1 Tax=Streptomyces acidicola TaxID=2596892 RepID=UPI003418A003